MGEKKHEYNIWIRKPEGKGILERYSVDTEDYIKVDREEVECQSMN
jgi:hypothetical protein